MILLFIIFSDKLDISFSSDLKGRKFGYSVESSVASDDVLQGNRNGISSDGSLMGGESFSLAWV
jgi:hypothetical protein